MEKQRKLGALSTLTARILLSGLALGIPQQQGNALAPHISPNIVPPTLGKTEPPLPVMEIKFKENSSLPNVSFTVNPPPIGNTNTQEPGINSTDSSATENQIVIRENIHYVQPIANWNTYDFMGAPTISQDVFVQILQQAGSPAESNGVHEGAAMWKAAVARGIDPNYILWTYFVESNFGTNGNYDRNVCNLEYAPDVKTVNGFADFRSQYGNDAFEKATAACADNLVRLHKEFIQANGGEPVTDILTLLENTVSPKFQNPTDAMIKTLHQKMLYTNILSLERHPNVILSRRVPVAVVSPNSQETPVYQINTIAA